MPSNRTRFHAIVEPDAPELYYTERHDPRLMLQIVTASETESEMKKRERFFISTTFNLK